MGTSYIYAWDPVGKVWVKVLVTADGKIKVKAA